MLSDGRKLHQRRCTVEGCQGQFNARGLCKYHHKKYLRLGIITVKKKVAREECSISGCGKKHLARGWCDSHYVAWRSYGDPLGRPKPAHRLKNIDPVARKADCEICGRINVMPFTRVRKDRAGRIETGWSCHGSKFRYRRIPRDRCSRCGFVPEHTTQIDVDHIVSKYAADADGNIVKNGVKMNADDPRNLRAVCANCHRYLTWWKRVHGTDAW